MKAALLLVLQLLVLTAKAETVLVCGSKVLCSPLGVAAKVLKEKGINIQIGSDEGSSVGISMLGNGLAQLAVSSRPLTAEDRSNFPQVSFSSIYLGEQALALCVSRDLWEGGIRALTRGQIQSIYEGRIKNWKDLGGPDQRIHFLSRPLGGGAWEVFAEWLYGDNRKAPLGNFQSLAEDLAVKKALANGTGKIAPLTPACADGSTVFVLKLAQNEEDTAQAPSAENLLSRRYKMTRPLYLFFDDKPTGSLGVLIDFLLSKDGQDILSQHGLVSRMALERETGQQLQLQGPSPR